MDRRIPARSLNGLVQSLLQGVGVPTEDAAVAAEVLVGTSLDGVDTHGITRLPVYLSRLQDRQINPAPSIARERTGASFGRVDGDNGLGQVVGAQAMEFASQMAQETGVGLVAVRRSNHFGAAGYYCAWAAQRGLVALVVTNTPPAIPPWGGRKPFFGTNPVAFGFPAPTFPIVVDLSASAVARGHIILAAQRGEPIPADWAVDEEGRPTEDPQRALQGALLPVGGAKGYALAVAVEMMAGVITGAAVGPGVGWMYEKTGVPADVGHFLIVFDPFRFIPPDEYEQRVSSLIEQVHGAERAAGVNEIFLPGERRRRTREQRLKEGIPVDPKLWEELILWARRLDLDFPEPEIWESKA
ncbi:Ldh family oxidoreductase [Kyrpidia spormannii]|uniref:Malate/lactate/ureidoglycolate dehydrogenase, LDH2 family n=1 Tax=Kyrpidia spormannii TaxID=2055160 RepID=A0ACA8Z802_9BACL|nr:Ldh family oxidoreductase [Kyrpidia spormannii]CAB3391430.1 Malate/lactate/ureidoglycolate dehydrogenase, LDH2 family [Kyrpidia spormannii]